MATAMSPKSSPASAEPASRPYLDLWDICSASAKIGGTWDVFVLQPYHHTYQYTWHGSPRQGTNFLCNLVSSADPLKYCQAQFRKTSHNGADYDAALKKYQHGARFVMSKVRFIENVSAAYVSCPCKHVVDLTKTKMDPWPGQPVSAVQPDPREIVASSSSGDRQLFHATAPGPEVGETLNCESNSCSAGQATRKRKHPQWLRTQAHPQWLRSQAHPQ